MKIRPSYRDQELSFPLRSVLCYYLLGYLLLLVTKKQNQELLQQDDRAKQPVTVRNSDRKNKQDTRAPKNRGKGSV